MQGKLVRAVRLFGAAATLRHAKEGFFDPRDRAADDRNVAMTRAQLDDAIFAAAWATGQALTLEQSIAEALQPD